MDPCHRNEIFVFASLPISAEDRSFEVKSKDSIAQRDFVPRVRALYPMQEMFIVSSTDVRKIEVITRRNERIIIPFHQKTLFWRFSDDLQ